jgi:hypothetical protein
MKEYFKNFETGFVFDFFKMDKNKCPKNFCKNRLTDKKNYYDILFLSCEFKRYFYFFMCKKNLKIFSLDKLWGH